jgi:hypothetical protein
MSEELYYCYCDDCWGSAHIREEELDLTESETAIDLVYLGQLRIPPCVLVVDGLAGVDRLFTAEDKYYHAIVADFDEEEVIPSSFISFKSADELDAALRGAGIIEGLTDERFILMPLTMKR